jgi:RNA polymerase sigma factor (sigma-70 family)
MNDMTETRILLARYVEDGSESAFRELVEGYINLVYSTALRLVEGDSHRAEDVTQTVFVRLTQKARTLAGDVSLGGWLHRDTCYVAATLMRSERRRQVRERQAVEMNALDDNTNLDSVLPVLDDAINQLGDEDRAAIILRFFEQRNFRALAETVGGSEDAARMRVNRALDKLHGLLKSRGVALSLTGLATLLGAKAVAAAPVGLAASVAGGAAAGGAASAAGTVAHTVSKGWKFAMLPVAALILAVAVGVHYSHSAAQNASSPPQSQKAIVAGNEPPTPVTQLAATSEPTDQNAPAAAVSGMKFQALDADSQKPVAGAKLQVAYFRDDGKTKGADLQTASDGTAQVEFPQFPYVAVNLFVSAPGHVPLVVNWQNGNMPTNYVMKLPVGTLAGGTVLNESQQPVANATVHFSTIGGNDPTKRENIQYVPRDAQRTDSDGHWSSDMMPVSVEKIVLMVEHPDYALLTTQLDLNVPSATNSSLVMLAGTPVNGAVTDSDGNPVAGARVRRISSRAEAENAATTDAAGHFQLRHMVPGDLELAVQVDGFGPIALQTIVSNEPLNLTFKLGPASIFRGRVLDEKGAPVSNASVLTTSDNYGLRRFVWSARTDEQGKFQWDSAPADPLPFRFDAPGFSATEATLKADGGEHEIRLKRLGIPANSLLKITGTVSDEETGLPLDDFKVLIGDAANLEMPVRFSFGTDGKNGAFDFRTRMNYAYQIQIQKDGYLPIATTNLIVKDGDQTLTFKLRKDNGLNGTVFLPDGKPAVDATVFLYELQGGVYMDKPGKVHNGYPVTEAQSIQTDDHGKFSFAAKLHPCGFVCVHDQGYADVPLTNFNGEIVLQPWGRVEGKLIVSGKSAAGQKISLENLNFMHNPSANRRSFPALQLWLEASTGPDGSFVFEKVPPGERKITQRLVRTAPGAGRLYDTQGKPVTVAPGVVTHVELGGHGSTISGHAVFSGTTQFPIVWSQVAVELTLKVPNINDSAPKPEQFSSTEAFSAAWKSFRDLAGAYWESEAGREFVRSRRLYSAYCSDDGSFEISDVSSGQYNLKISIRQLPATSPGEFDGKEVGVLDMDFKVPEASDDEHPMLDLGTLQVPDAKSDPAHGR